MSEAIKNVLGDELYNQVVDKLGKDNTFDFTKDYIPKTRFNEVNAKSKEFEKQITALNKQIETGKNLISENEDLKNKYTVLEEDFNKNKDLHTQEITNISKRFKVETALRDAGAKHCEMLLTQVDLNKLTLDGDNIIGLDDTIKGLKTTYEDMFVNTSTNSTPPSNTDGQNGNDDSDDNSGDWDFMKTL